MINLKKLLTEEVKSKKPKIQESADLVRSGLEKVFANGGAEIPYRRLENVGLGYIRSVSEAIKIAVQESRKVAKSYGYKDDENNEKFIKEENNFGKMSAEKGEDRLAQVASHEPSHSETDMSNPAEKEEVRIGKAILTALNDIGGEGIEIDDSTMVGLGEIKKLAEELIAMHKAK